MSSLYDKHMLEEQFYDEKIDKKRRHISKQIAVAVLEDSQLADLLLDILARAYYEINTAHTVETLYDKLGFDQEDYAAVSNDLENYIKVCKETEDYFGSYENELRSEAAIDTYHSLYA